MLAGALDLDPPRSSDARAVPPPRLPGFGAAGAAAVPRRGRRAPPPSPRCANRSASETPVRVAVPGHLLGRPLGDDAPALAARAWAEIDDPICRGDDVEIVIDDDPEAPSATSTENAALRCVTSAEGEGRRSARRGGRARQRRARRARGDLQPLRLTAGERRERLELSGRMAWSNCRMSLAGPKFYRRVIRARSRGGDHQGRGNAWTTVALEILAESSTPKFAMDGKLLRRC